LFNEISVRRLKAIVFHFSGSVFRKVRKFRESLLDPEKWGWGEGEAAALVQHAKALYVEVSFSEP
jgi:hypothetical protein